MRHRASKGFLGRKIGLLKALSFLFLDLGFFFFKSQTRFVDLALLSSSFQKNVFVVFVKVFSLGCLGVRWSESKEV